MKSIIIFCFMVLFLIVGSVGVNAYYTNYGDAYQDYMYRKHTYQEDKSKYYSNYGYQRDYSWNYNSYYDRYGSRYNPEWRSGYVSPNYKNRLYGHTWTPSKYTAAWYETREYLHCTWDDGKYSCHKTYIR